MTPEVLNRKISDGIVSFSRIEKDGQIILVRNNKKILYKLLLCKKDVIIKEDFGEKEVHFLRGEYYLLGDKTFLGEYSLSKWEVNIFEQYVRLPVSSGRFYLIHFADNSITQNEIRDIYNNFRKENIPLIKDCFCSSCDEVIKFERLLKITKLNNFFYSE